MVRVNGEMVDCAGMTIEQYVNANNYKKERLAIERNGDIIPKKDYENVKFEDGDKVEIVSFVGGG